MDGLFVSFGDGDNGREEEEEDLNLRRNSTDSNFFSNARKREYNSSMHSN
jgi:hypothetical protein